MGGWCGIMEWQWKLWSDLGYILEDGHTGIAEGDKDLKKAMG